MVYCCNLNEIEVPLLNSESTPQRSSQAEHMLCSHSLSGIQCLTLFTRMGLLLCTGLTMTLLPIPTASMQENKHPSLPTPRYIPAGFNLRSVLWNPANGFGGGDNEREMIYVRGGPDRVTHRNLPLQVIVSSDLKHEFAYTEKADGLHEIIYMDDGTELEGKYFDGEWVLMRDGTRYWDSEHVHSLVFDYLISMSAFERRGRKSALRNCFELLVLSPIRS